MQCPSCGNENSARVKFCAECGTPIGIPCPDCSFRNARDAAICGSCGRSLDAVQSPAAERRQLTVFFADIVGSTALAESLDPEDLRDLYARYQTLCANAVQHFDGYIAQYLGDGVLAYFGYPAAHEDDAGRAVRAGLEILDHVANLSTGGKQPSLRIGIHTGLVVIGDVGASGRREQLALGEAPNIAARLQAEALPDTLVISDATQSLLAGQFALEDLGSRTLKGLSRPMQIYRVLGESAASRFQAMKIAHGLTPFVGRDREVAAIRGAWHQAVNSRGQSILLRGEAGMGKSRLLETAGQVAASRLHEVFEAQCSPYQMNSPLFPIVEMIERRIGIEDEMSPSDKLDLLEQFTAGRGVAIEHATAALASLLSIPTHGRFSEIDLPPSKRLQVTIEVVADLLLHAVNGAPVLLLIEDLHWADPSTLNLFGEMVARIPNLPVLMVSTTRPEFSPPWLGQPHCTEIRVEALNPDDARALIAHVAGPKRLPIALVQEVVTRTGGIPLFIEAVTRTAMSSGLLRELDDRYELAGPVPSGLIPPTVQDSLMARIDRLGADKPVAQLAATIGRESSFDLLLAVHDRPAASLSAALRKMVELGLVSEQGSPPSSTYTFSHALIQDAAYESLLRKTRQDFHDKIAEALLQRFPEIADTKPELLARHHEGAGRIAEATAGWIKAGKKAKERLALRECEAYLRKTISLLETLPEDDPARLQSEMEAQLALGHALTETLGWASHDVERAFTRARELCEKLGNNVGLYEALNGLAATHFLLGELPQAVEDAKPVVQMAIAIGDPIFQITAGNLISYPSYYRADFESACAYADQALTHYTVDRERAIVMAFHLPASFAVTLIRALCLWCLGYGDQAQAGVNEALAIIDALNIPVATTFSMGYMLYAHYLRRDVDAIANLAGEAYARAQEEAYPYWTSSARIFRGWAQAMRGEMEAGIADMQVGLESYRLTGTGLNTSTFCMMTAEVLQKAGRLDEALASLAKGIEHVAKFDEHLHEPELHRLQGEIHLQQGNVAAGEASLRCAVESAQRYKARMFEARAAARLALLLRGQGRISEACTLLEPLDEWFQEGRDLKDVRQVRDILHSLKTAQNPLRHASA